MKGVMRPAAALASLALASAGGVDGKATPRTYVGSTVSDAPDCTARVGYDRDQVLPGFLLPTAAGARTCIPFTTTAATPPAGYHGDFYVDEFSDAKLRQKWRDCKKEPACFARVTRQIDARQPPNRDHFVKDPAARFLLGKIVEPAAGPLDLGTIRRPAFFARQPYHEAIASLDTRTSVVEFTVPADPFERLEQHEERPVKLRGWYLRGDGVARGEGRRRRALIVMTGGGATHIAGVTDPHEILYHITPDGSSVPNAFPDATTGAPGQAAWRRIANELVRAGFDVLLYDRRGVGVSTGFCDTNTLQQGRDILAMTEALRSGVGLRAMDPGGATLAGAAAARSLRGDDPRDGLPLLLLGDSRGTMATGWAMTMNFWKDCDYDLPVATCRPAREDRRILGAMLVGEFASGVGYVTANNTPDDEARGLGRDRGLFIAGSEEEKHIVFFPSSAILAGMHRWPGVFIAKGLWDYAASLQGTVDAYARVPGRKELMVVRGPHPFETWPEAEQQRLIRRLKVFATSSIAGGRSLPGGRGWHDLRSLVATSSDVWESSTTPTLR